MFLSKLQSLFSKSQPPKSDWIKQTLNQRVNQLGLKNWDGNYTWSSDFNANGIKFVLKYTLMKGNQGTFSFGVCTNFIPSIQKHKKVVFHTAPKKPVLQLFDSAYGWRNSFQGEKLSDTVSHWSEKDFERDLNKLLKKYTSIIQDWFKSNQTLEQLITTSSKQTQDESYKINHPSPLFIYGYLLATNNQEKEGINQIKSYYSSLIQNQQEFKQDLDLVLNHLKTVGNT